MQIDNLLAKLDNASNDLERLREEKDQEIMILQAGMDSTIEQLSEAKQVILSFLSSSRDSLATRIKGYWMRLRMPRSILSSWTIVRNWTKSLVSQISEVGLHLT